MKMMKKNSIWIVVVISLLLITTSIALAQPSRSALKDIWCLVTPDASCYNTGGLQLASQGVTGCSPTQIAFIGWDLSDVSAQIGTVELTLTTYYVTGVEPNTLTFELFAPLDVDWAQNWTENTSQTTSPGGLGATLATASVALEDDVDFGTNPQTVFFAGGVGSALVQYLNDLQGETRESATVGVRITGGCTLNPFVAFYDREGSFGSEELGPDLILFTPTAVRFVSSSASGDAPASFVPVMLVVALLGLIALTATLYYKPLPSQD
jgi:hypothetical protein